MPTLIFNLAALVGGSAQGLTGFGAGTVTVTVLALMFPFREVVAVVALLVVVPNLMLAWLTRHELDWRRGPVAAVSISLGIIIGGQLLVSVPEGWLKRALGLIILVYVVVTLVRAPSPERMPRFGLADGCALAAVAFVSGIIIGAVGTSPIPVLIYITVRYPKHKARAILTQTFVVSSIVQNVVYAGLGVLTPDLVWLMLSTVPGVALGLLIGNRWHHRVNQKTFGRALALLLAIPAVELLLGIG